MIEVNTLSVLAQFLSARVAEVTPVVSLAFAISVAVRGLLIAKC